MCVSRMFYVDRELGGWEKLSVPVWTHHVSTEAISLKRRKMRIDATSQHTSWLLLYCRAAGENKHTFISAQMLFIRYATSRSRLTAWTQIDGEIRSGQGFVMGPLAIGLWRPIHVSIHLWFWLLWLGLNLYLYLYQSLSNPDNPVVSGWGTNYYTAPTNLNSLLISLNALNSIWNPNIAVVINTEQTVSNRPPGHGVWQSQGSWMRGTYWDLARTRLTCHLDR